MLSISIGSSTGILIALCGDRELPRNRVGLYLCFLKHGKKENKKYLALGILRVSAAGRFGFSIVAVDGRGMVRVNVASPDAPISDTFGSEHFLL